MVANYKYHDVISTSMNMLYTELPDVSKEHNHQSLATFYWWVSFSENMSELKYKRVNIYMCVMMSFIFTSQ